MFPRSSVHPSAHLSVSTWFLLSNLSSFSLILLKFCAHMYITGEWFGIVNGRNLLTSLRVVALAY